MADTLQRTLMMGVDETGQPVPMPIREDGNASSIASLPDIGVDSMPTLTIGVMPNLVVSTMPTLAVNNDGTEMLLSGSTTGRGIKVAAAATPGTLIHTAIVGVSQIDFIHLYAVNSDSVDRKLTLEWGGVTVPDDSIEITIPFESGLVQLTPDGGLPLQNTLVVRAFAAAANVICIHGKVRRK